MLSKFLTLSLVVAACWSNAVPVRKGNVDENSEVEVLLKRLVGDMRSEIEAKIATEVDKIRLEMSVLKTALESSLAEEKEKLAKYITKNEQPKTTPYLEMRQPWRGNRWTRKPSTGPTPAADDIMRVSRDKDCYGHDIGGEGFFAPRAECWAQCNANPECVSFLWMKSESWCWIKNHVCSSGELQHDAGKDYYVVRKPAGFEYHYGTEISPEELGAEEDPIVPFNARRPKPIPEAVADDVLRIHRNSDCFGHDIGGAGFEAPLVDCKQLCENKTTCVSFLWMKHNSWCWLKNHVCTKWELRSESGKDYFVVHKPAGSQYQYGAPISELELASENFVVDTTQTPQEVDTSIRRVLNSDCWGFDIGGEGFMASLLECKNKCQLEKTCKSFLWMESDSWCWNKSRACRRYELQSGAGKAYYVMRRDAGDDAYGDVMDETHFDPLAANRTPKLFVRNVE